MPPKNLVEVVIGLVDKMTPGLDGSAKKVEGWGTKVKGVFQAVGAIAAAVGLAAFFKKGIEDAIEGEHALETFKQTLKNVGTTFEQVEPSANAMYDTLKKTSRFAQTDMQIALETLTVKTGDYDVALGHMQLTADLAAKDHSTMGEAAEKVAKILAGVGGKELKQYGITTTDVAEAVKQLSERLAGQSEHELTTTGGKLAQLKERWFEVGEAVGAAIIGNDQLSSSTGGVTGMLIDLERWIGLNSEGISGFVDALITIGKVLVDVVDGVVMNLLALINGFQGVVVGAFSALTGGAGTFVENLGRMIAGASGLLQKVGIDLGKGLGEDLIEAGQGMRRAGDAQLEYASGALTMAGDQIKKAFEFKAFLRNEDVKGQKGTDDELTSLETRRVAASKAARDKEQAQLVAARKKMRELEIKSQAETKAAASALHADIMHIIGELIPPVIDTVTRSIDELREAGENAMNPAQVLEWKGALAGTQQVLDPLTGKYVTLADYVKLVKERSKDTEENVGATFDQIRNVANGALGVASTFGIISKETENALKNVIDIADNIPAILTGDPTAILAVAGALGSVLTTVFGTSADDRARKELLRKNTQGLEDLIRVNRGLLEFQTGAKQMKEIADVLRAVQDLRGFDFQVGLQDELSARGLTQADLAALAQDMDVDMNAHNWVEVLLGKLDALLSAPIFGTGFAGEMERIRREFEATGEDDPLARFRAVAGAVGQFGGAGAGALFSGTNEEILARLTRLITEGDSDQILALSGDLTPTEFLDAIQDLIELLRSSEEEGPAEEGAAAGGFGGISNPDFALPDFDLPGGASDGAARAGGGTAAAGGRGSGGGNITIGDVTINVGVGVDLAKGTQYGHDLWDAFLERVDVGMGRRLTQERINNGNSVLS